MTEPASRRRWITVGETIGLAALIVSALGLYLTWRSSQEDRTTRIVEQKQAIPLVLRGKTEGDGRSLVIEPVESGHALVALTLMLAGESIELGSDGRLEASAVKSAVESIGERKGTRTVPVRVAARYVENGTERRVSGAYTLGYRWVGGGLFEGRSVRLTRFSR